MNGLRRQWLLVFGAALAPLLLGEFGVRLFSKYGVVTPEILRQINLAYVPSVFSSYEFERGPKEINAGPDWGNVKWRINARGYRGPDFSIPKPPGAFRILCYGGSSTFDMGQPEGKDWPRRIERFLQEHRHPAAEVINAGVPGHAAYDAVGRLFAEGHYFEPDVALFYGAWNDLKRFDSGESLLRELRPYADMDPRLYYQGSFDRSLCEISQLYVRLRHRYYNARLGTGLEGRLRTAPLTETLHPAALVQYRASLAAFVDIARNAGATPVLMTEARLVTSHAPESARGRIVYGFQPFTHAALCQAFEKADEIVREVAAWKQVVLIDASPLNGQAALFKDHVHLTDAGSQALAEIAGEALLNILAAGKGNQ